MPKKPKKPSYLDIAKEFRKGKTIVELAQQHRMAYYEIESMIRRALKGDKG